MFRQTSSSTARVVKNPRSSNIATNQSIDSNQILVKKRALGSVPLLVNLDDLIQGSEPCLTQIPFVDLMPILLFDLNALSRYSIKQQLDRITLNEIERLTTTKHDAPNASHFCLTDADESITSFLQIDSKQYQEEIDRGISQVLRSSRCEQLRRLYHLSVFNVQPVELKCRGRESMQQNAYDREELKSLIQSLEAALHSDSYHKLFQNIVEMDRNAHSTLNDEICLLSTRWVYATSALSSLRDGIRQHVQSVRNRFNQSTIHRHHLLYPQPTEIWHPNLAHHARPIENASNDVNDTTRTQHALGTDLLRFNDLERFLEARRRRQRATANSAAAATYVDDRRDLPSSSELVFQVLLNELAHVSIEITRDLLIYLATAIDHQSAGIHSSMSVIMSDAPGDSRLRDMNCGYPQQTGETATSDYPTVETSDVDELLDGNASAKSSWTRKVTCDCSVHRQLSVDEHVTVKLPLHLSDDVNWSSRNDAAQVGQNGAETPSSLDGGASITFGLTGKVRSRLQALLCQLYERKLLKKKLQSEPTEPDADLYLAQLWKCVVEAVQQLNSSNAIYVAQIRLSCRRQLRQSAAFVARRYVYELQRRILGGLFCIVSELLTKIPPTWAHELQLTKLKLDSLFDYALVTHLKNDALALLKSVHQQRINVVNASTTNNASSADPIVVQQGETEQRTIRWLNETLWSGNVHEILTELIALVNFRLMVGRPLCSPLYKAFQAEHVKLSERELNNFTNVTSASSGASSLDQSPLINKSDSNTMNFKSGEEGIWHEIDTWVGGWQSIAGADPAKPITDIIENEILMRYLHLAPKLDCLQEVAESGTRIALELAMSRHYQVV